MRLFKPNIPKMLARKDLRGLVQALGDEESQIVWEAASALGDLNDPHAGELLMEAVRQPSARVGALLALGFTGNLQGLTPLTAALHDSDARVRRAAAFALPMLPLVHDSLAVEPLAGALKDVDHNVRLEAATSLAMMKDARGIDYLIELVRDPHGRGMRNDAARALGKYGGARAVEALLAAIHDQDILVREAATEALGKLKDPSSIEPLRAALKDSRLEVRMAASEALEAITGERHFVLALGNKSQ
jgi:HEAT repeat protein